jgi:hypothetical protein
MEDIVKVKKTLKDYYAENPEKYLSKLKEKVPCPECKYVTAKANMWRHKQSIIHKTRLFQMTVRKENKAKKTHV